MGEDWHGYLVRLVGEQRGVHERQGWALPGAVDAIEAALAEIERLRAEVERLRAELASAESCYHWRRNDCSPNDSE